MKIAIFANGILLNGIGGAQKHMKEVLSRLAKKYEIIYFPEIQVYGSKDINLAYMSVLESYKIKISDYFIKNKGNKVAIKSVLENYVYEIKNCMIIYDLDFQYYLDNFKYGGAMSARLSQKTGIKLGVCLQDLGDVKSSFFQEIYSMYKFTFLAPELSIFAILAGFYDYFNRKITLEKLQSNHNLLFMSIINNDYKKNIKINFKNIEAIEPSNALDETIKKYQGIKKENKLIFFARLIYRKGIFDIIYVAKKIAAKQNVKIIICGAFARDYEKKIFFRMVKKNKLENTIEYRGKLNDDELYHEISTSKVMVYPSHSDSFSISILQALELNVFVSAYDIPGLSLYKQFKEVTLSKEFDTNALADSALNFLTADKNMFDDIELNKFIDVHSNWQNVAEQHMKIIDKYCK